MCVDTNGHSMENALLYSAANGLQRTDARKILQEVVPELKLKTGVRVLDVGCGSGDVTAEVLLPLLPPDFEEVVGVDVSEKMILHAREIHGSTRLNFVQLNIEDETNQLFQTLTERMYHHNKNSSGLHETLTTKKETVDILINGMKLEEGDLKKWPTSEEEDYFTKEAKMKNNNVSDLSVKFCCEETKFDFISSFYCLHWIQNQSQALTNIYSLLKHGGESVLVLLANSSIFTLYENLAKIPKWSHYMKDVKKFISPYHHSEDPARDLADLAISVGFHVVSLECRCRNFVYPDYASLKDAIKAVNPFFPRLSPTQGKSYIADCLTVIQQHNLAEEVNDGLQVEYTLLVAQLRK